MKKKMKKRTKESVKDPKCLVDMGWHTLNWRKSCKRNLGKVYTFDTRSLRCKSVILCHFRPEKNVYDSRQECQRTCLKPNDPIFKENTKIFIDKKDKHKHTYLSE